MSIETPAPGQAEASPIRLVDPRQPRFGQALTGGIVLLGFIVGWPQVLPAIAVVLAGAALGGSSINLYTHLYRGFKQVAGLAPPAELEEAAPPRFANTVGFVFLAAATLAWVLDVTIVAWTLGLIVSSLALLAAITGLCVGCELYLAARRVTTGVRPPRRFPARGHQAQEQA